MRALTMSFLVNVFQSIVDFSHFGSQKRQISAGIGGDLFAAVDTGVLFDVRSYIF